MSIRSFIICVMSLALYDGTAVADAVYTWVDDDGVTHYSDTPPSKGSPGAGEVETVAMPGGFPEVAEVTDNYYSIVNQWQRIQEERARKEELDLERRRLRLEASRLAQAERRVTAAEDDGDGPPSVVYGGGFYHPSPHAFPRGRNAFFGDRGIHGRFRHTGHHNSRDQQRPRQRQNYVGNNASAAKPGTGFSLSVSPGLR